MLIGEGAKEWRDRDGFRDPRGTSGSAPSREKRALAYHVTQASTRTGLIIGRVIQEVQFFATDALDATNALGKSISISNDKIESSSKVDFKFIIGSQFNQLSVSRKTLNSPRLF